MDGVITIYWKTAPRTARYEYIAWIAGGVETASGNTIAEAVGKLIIHTKDATSGEPLVRLERVYD